MWPYLLDMTKDESMQHLRCLEIDAFSALVTALRAQGHLDREKLKLLKETGIMLGITKDRYKAEIRRVVNDERLNTIAYHVTGERYNSEDWADEGQRLIPLIPRIAPQTLYSAIADDVADSTIRINRSLPMPASTERKRSALSPPTYPSSTSDLINKVQFRTVEPDCKKRKISVGMENSSLAHLMAPPKISKIQQIYRQRSKNKLNEQFGKIKSQDSEKLEFMHQAIVQRPHQPPALPHLMHQHVRPKLMVNPAAVAFIAPKINIIQNINSTTYAAHVNTTSSMLAGSSVIGGFEQNLRQHTAIVKYPFPTTPITISMPTVRPQITLSNVNSTASIKSQVENAKTNIHENVKLQSYSQENINFVIKNENGQSDRFKNTFDNAENASLLVVPKTISSDGQHKVIVSMVSSNQIITTSPSILQRTLTTLPFKNIPIKGIDKFKLVATNSTNQQQTTSFYPAFSNQKVVAVRNAINKKIIPLSQVQVVNTKDGIKVFPIGGKIFTSNNNGNYYLTNTCVNVDTTNSTQVTMSSKEEEKAGISELPLDNGSKIISSINLSTDEKTLSHETNGNYENDETNDNTSNIGQLVDGDYCSETIGIQDAEDFVSNGPESVENDDVHAELNGEVNNDEIDPNHDESITKNTESFEMVAIPGARNDVPVETLFSSLEQADNNIDYSSSIDHVNNDQDINHEPFLGRVIDELSDYQVNTCKDKDDSANYIYDNDNTTEEVIIDELENHHNMEVLNNIFNVHEESFPQIKNVTS